MKRKKFPAYFFHNHLGIGYGVCITIQPLTMKVHEHHAIFLHLPGFTSLEAVAKLNENLLKVVGK